MQLHGTLHLAQPHGLKQLQAMPNDHCQILSNRAAGCWMSDKICVQCLPRQDDHFRFKKRGGGEGEQVGWNQGRPTHGLTGRNFFGQDVLFLAPDLQSAN